ncbi:EFR1 family ferrodoxin [Chloroflexota bacterium]
MVITKVSAVYFSPTGTTEKAVTAFVTGMGIPFEKFNLTTPKVRQAFKHSFSKDELVVAGLPVYAGRLPWYLDDFFSGLEGDRTPAVASVMYGNREYGDALIELGLRLEERGFIVKAGAAFIGEHTFSNKIATGRPNANDLAVIANLGKKTLVSIANNISAKPLFRGNYPFVAKGYDPSATSPTRTRIATIETCTLCHLCAEECPWGVINTDDCKTIDYAKCSRCFRCIKICPVGAKQVTDETFLNFLPQFEERLNANRREPELFLPQ